MQIESINGSTYILTFIDDYSRTLWVYFPRLKSEVFTTVKKFKVLVETQSKKKIKAIRSDRGSEYASQEFTQFLEETCIQRQLTVSYTPQQNELVVRRNRTLLEMARYMLKAQGMPEIFWSEAVFNYSCIFAEQIIYKVTKQENTTRSME